MSCNFLTLDSFQHRESKAETGEGPFASGGRAEDRSKAEEAGRARAEVQTTAELQPESARTCSPDT